MHCTCKINQPPVHGPAGVSLAVGVGSGVLVSVAGGLGVSVAVSVKVAVGVGVLLGVGEGVSEGVGEGVKVSVGVAVGGCVQVLNCVAVSEGVRVGVTGVGVETPGLVWLGLGVSEGGAVCVGDGLGISVAWNVSLSLSRTSSNPLQ